MTNILQLPLLRVAAGVQVDEDFTLAIVFTLSDGVTPLSLAGLSFAASIGSISTLSTSAGSITIAGASSNILTMLVPAATKTAWGLGVYQLALTASDGTYTRDVFGSSSLTVGSPSQVSLATLTGAGAVNTAAATISPAVAAAISTIGLAASMATSLAALSSSQLQSLALSLVAALPAQSGPSAPVAAGQPFVDSSGFVVIAQ